MSSNESPSVVARLAAAIEYPEQVPNDASSYTFVSDGVEINARTASGRLILETVLWTSDDGQDDEASAIPTKLAVLALGRILREEATLAWNPERDALVLWQDVPASFPDDKLRRLFEVFSVSCDWWRSRVRDETEDLQPIPELVIRP